jgi:hypothetical protein
VKAQLHASSHAHPWPGDASHPLWVLDPIGEALPFSHSSIGGRGEADVKTASTSQVPDKRWKELKSGARIVAKQAAVCMEAWQELE